MKRRFFALVLLLAWISPSSAEPSSKASRLGDELTPLGAERAGSEDGQIPAWQGGLRSAPPCYRKGGRYCDPYAGERPHQTINIQNLDDWRDKLSAGHIELLQRHPDSYRIELYRTHRSFANPEAVYAAAKTNAQKAVLAPSGREVRDASIAIPFPIPSEGLELVWNHRLRYRGPGFQRWIQQAAVSATGEAKVTDFLEQAHFPYGQGQKLDDFMALYWLRTSIAPESLAGTLSLIHDSINHEEEPSIAWQRGADGQIMLRDRSYGFDQVALQTSSLRLDDQLDSWFGNPERYTWKLIDKTEMVVPYNSYALHNRDRFSRLVHAGHLNPSLPRYELHRVWVVDGNTKPSAVHRVKRRRLYIDEDSWQVLMVDLYETRNKIWRAQETHTVMAQDHAALVPTAELIYDFDSARYLIQAVADDKPEFSFREFSRRDFRRGRAQGADYRALAELPAEEEPES